jgi:hypothetical protein
MQSNAPGYCALHAAGIELKNVSGTIVYGMIGWQNGTLVGPHVVLIARGSQLPHRRSLPHQRQVF